MYTLNAFDEFHLLGGGGGGGVLPETKCISKLTKEDTKKDSIRYSDAF